MLCRLLQNFVFLRVQTDKKNLGTKAMLAEIRELGEKFNSEDDVPEALGATFPFSARLRPFLTLDCMDRCGRVVLEMAKPCWTIVFDDVCRALYEGMRCLCMALQGTTLIWAIACWSKAGSACWNKAWL